MFGIVIPALGFILIGVGIGMLIVCFLYRGGDEMGKKQRRR